MTFYQAINNLASFGSLISIKQEAPVLYVLDNSSSNEIDRLDGSANSPVNIENHVDRGMYHIWYGQNVPRLEAVCMKRA